MVKNLILCPGMVLFLETWMGIHFYTSIKFAPLSRAIIYEKISLYHNVLRDPSFAFLPGNSLAVDAATVGLSLCEVWAAEHTLCAACAGV